MRFTLGQRRLELAAGEFARFGAPPQGSAGGAGGRWRMETGREWHAELRRQIEEHGGGGDDGVVASGGGSWAFEVPIKTALVCEGWILAIEGRADQIWSATSPAPTPRILVREIKTVSVALPRPAEWWRENFPEFFLQLALYCHGLAQREPRHAEDAPDAAAIATAAASIEGVLVLLEPATGVVQEIPLGRAPLAWLEPQARAVARFAQSRWDGRLRLEHLRLHEPFAEPRAEWSAALERLDAETAPVVLLEAPTGFGKTSLALLDALRRLRDGEAARIVYVTGKNSARLQVHREMERLARPGSVRVFTLHARAEHDIAGIPDDPAVWRENWRRAAIDPDQLFNEDRADLESIRALGAAAAVPPWEITRRLLPLAELILCDYNYVFSPWQAGVLDGIPGWDAAATHLIVDEAHNLPARAAEARSVEADAPSAWDAHNALREARAPREWLRQWETWAAFLEELRARDSLGTTDIYLARDSCAEITRLWQRQPLFSLELPRPVMDVLEQPAQLLPILAREDDGTDADSGADGGGGALPPYLLWSPRQGTLRAGCLDASRETGAALRSFASVRLMSATLAPVGIFAAECGLTPLATAADAQALPAHCALHTCDAPWREAAYDVRVDATVDTRFDARERHYADTAQAVLDFCAAAPAAIFFPSYAYAEAIQTYLRALAPGFRATLQPRGATPAENAAWLDESLLLAHALLLVAGGALAEGVDILGGRLDRAMVVSPCLPEVTPERAARMDALRRAGVADPFRHVYLVPALRKVNQSLGRLVRAPGQRAAVLLHCRRFATPAIRSLLAPEYRRET